jgi:hypothetical protein
MSLPHGLSYPEMQLFFKWLVISLERTVNLIRLAIKSRGFVSFNLKVSSPDFESAVIPGLIHLQLQTTLGLRAH